MAEYIAQSEDLTAVADAIRAKGSTTEQLSFPDGMVDAIGNIDTKLPEQEKTATPSTSSVIVTPDTGKTLSKVTVNAMPSGVLNTPTVSSSGLITAKVGTSGYLASGAQKTTQLSRNSGGTYTPTTSDATLASSGQYMTGPIVMKGDSNLVPENIQAGVTIFGVTGTREDFAYAEWRAGNQIFGNVQTIYWDNMAVPSNLQISSIAVQPNGYFLPTDGGIYAYLNGYYAMCGYDFSPDGKWDSIGFSYWSDPNSMRFYMSINNSDYYWSNTYYTLTIAGYLMQS